MTICDYLLLPVLCAKYARQIFLICELLTSKYFLCAILMIWFVLIHYNCEAYQEIQRFSVMHHRL